MSNMTKTIAILGVVAGLGVSALSMGAYAADPEVVEWKNGGDDTNAPAESTSGYGTYENNNWVKTSTAINLNVPDSLSIDATTDAVTLFDSAGNGQYLSGTMTGEEGSETFTAGGVNVQVISRHGKGYTLKMIGDGEGDVETDLVNGSYTIPTGAISDITEFVASTGDSAWGYRLDSAAPKNDSITKSAAATDANAYLAVAEGGVEIDKMEGANDTTYAISFGAVVAAGQASGDYAGKVTFIATNNQ